MYEFFEYSNWIIIRALLTGCCALLGLVVSERLQAPSPQPETLIDLLVKIIFAILMGFIFAGITQWLIQFHLGYKPCVPLYWIAAVMGGYIHYNIIPYMIGVIQQLVQALVHKIRGSSMEDSYYSNHDSSSYGRKTKNDWDDDFEK